MKIISAIGDDATTFLQGQLTCDVQQVGESFSPAAWCTPKGRVIVVFRIRRVANGYDLLCPEDLTDAVMRRFIMYRLRSKVELQTRDATVDDLDGLSAADWLAGQVSAGIPHIDASNTEAFTPHMLNLDLAGAVSFAKGC